MLLAGGAAAQVEQVRYNPQLGFEESTTNLEVEPRQPDQLGSSLVSVTQSAVDTQAVYLIVKVGINGYGNLADERGRLIGAADLDRERASLPEQVSMCSRELRSFEPPLLSVHVPHEESVPHQGVS